MRAKGQEVTIEVTSATTGLEESLGNVMSCGLEYQIEKTSTGFLGEKSDRKDMIFKGISGNMEVQLEKAEVLRFADKVKAKAQRLPGSEAESFAITMTINLDDGPVRVLFEEPSFGPIPVNVGGREEFVSVSLEWECEDGRVLF